MSKQKLVISSNKFMDRLVKAGVIPIFTQRVVIECNLGEGVRLEIETYADEDLLKLDVKDIVTTEENNARHPKDNDCAT